MKNNIVIINKEYENRKHLFLQDPKSDLFVILRQKIYPLHRNFLNQVQYFKKAQIGQQKIQMLDSSLQPKWFEVVIGYYYGLPLTYSRIQGVQKLLQVLQFLKVPILIQKIYNDIKNNFDEYGFFLLLSISHKYQLKWLKKSCEQELTLMNFQQLNYNRYDLFKIDRQILQYVIRLHQLLKINQNIVGLSQSVIRKIIKQYCKSNNIQDMDIDHFFSLDQSTIDQTNQQLQNQTGRKRKSSQPIIKIEMLPEKQIVSKTTSYQQNIVSSSIVNEGQLQQKNQDIFKLRIINSEIHQKGSEMLEQINKVKTNFTNLQQIKPKDDDFSKIDEKFKKIQKIYHEEDAKYQNLYQNLKSQMEKLSPLRHKNKNTQNKSRSSQTSPADEKSKQKNDKNNKKNLIEMPKLSKKLDQ